jgi:hypothetical protein
MKLLLCFLLMVTPLFAQDVKQELERHLQQEYLEQVLETHGPCFGDQDCLIDQKTHVEIQLEQQTLCYPYTRCGFYECMETQYPCSSVGLNYFTKLAAPTCRNYVSNIQQDRFSQEGVEWIYEVMVCLQKGLFEECGLEGRCQRATVRESCEYIVDFTLSFHPGCYLESGLVYANSVFKINA